MKYRDYKTFAPGACFHVFNRGNGRMDIFRDEHDYENFLKRIRIVLGKKLQGAPLRLTPFAAGEFSLLSFCLMPNHFHLEVMQHGDIPIGKLLLKTCTSYSMYFNKKYQHVGHVFQDQFKAIPVDTDRRMIALSAYIHQNPKVAGLVDDLKKWPHSSYPDYLGIRADDLCDKSLLLRQFRGTRDYEEFVESRFESIKELKEITRLLLE